MYKEIPFKPETDLLINLARQHPETSPEEPLSQSFDYGEFLQLSFIHRVLPLVFHHIGISDDLACQFPSEIIDIGRILSESQKLRTGTLLGHAKELFCELSTADIRFMIFRGLLLATTVYRQPHWRNFEDIDLLIEEDNIQKVDGVLKDLGYIQGNFDPQTKSVVPYSEDELRFWEKDRQHLGSYLLETKEPFTAAVKIDVHYKLTNRYDPFTIHGRDLMKSSRTERILGTNVETIDLTDLLIALCVHIHSHSRWFYEMRDRNDLHLSRFTDIYEMVQKYKSSLDWDALIKRSRQFGISFPVALGLYWAAKIYGQFFPTEILESLKPSDFNERESEIALRDISGDDRVIAHWNESFLERLFDIDRYRTTIGLAENAYRLSPERPVGLSTYHF